MKYESEKDIPEGSVDDYLDQGKPTPLHTSPIRGDLFDGTLNGYQQAAQGTAIYPGKESFWGLVYVALKGAGEAGEFAEKVGKLMRDSGVQPSHTFLDMEDRAPGIRELLLKEIGDELWYIAAKCSELGITLEDVAHMNIKKLKSRQQRGTLSGSGDNR